MNSDFPSGENASPFGKNFPVMIFCAPPAPSAHTYPEGSFRDSPGQVNTRLPRMSNAKSFGCASLSPSTASHAVFISPLSGLRIDTQSLPASQNHIRPAASAAMPLGLPFGILNRESSPPFPRRQTLPP